MSLLDPHTLLEEIARDANDLDRLSKSTYEVTAIMDEAERVWESHYDATLKALEEEYADAGRKSVPEHMALSVARRAYPSEYDTYRRARRALARLKEQNQAKRGALSGRQSVLNALRDELKASA